MFVRLRIIDNYVPPGWLIQADFIAIRNAGKYIILKSKMISRGSVVDSIKDLIAGCELPLVIPAEYILNHNEIKQDIMGA